MAGEAWWAWLLLPLLFSAPWFIAALWVWRRSPRGALQEHPSMAELARRRLWTS